VLPQYDKYSYSAHGWSVFLCVLASAQLRFGVNKEELSLIEPGCFEVFPYLPQKLKQFAAAS